MMELRNVNQTKFCNCCLKLELSFALSIHCFMSIFLIIHCGHYNNCEIFAYCMSRIVILICLFATDEIIQFLLSLYLDFLIFSHLKLASYLPHNLTGIWVRFIHTPTTGKWWNFGVEWESYSKKLILTLYYINIHITSCTSKFLMFLFIRETLWRHKVEIRTTFW